MDLFRGDLEQVTVGPAFTFWPSYDDEAEKTGEKGTVLMSYHSQRSTTPSTKPTANKTPLLERKEPSASTRQSEGSSKSVKIRSFSHKEAKLANTDVRVSAPEISATPTLLQLPSPHKRPTERPSALVSSSSLADSSRSSKTVRVSHLRLNPSTVGAPKALLRSSKSNSKEPIPQNLLLTQKGGAKSYTSSIRVEVTPISAITVDLREQKMPYSVSSEDSKLQEVSSKEVRFKEDTTFSPTLTESSYSSVEDVGNTNLQLPSPRLEFEEAFSELPTKDKDAAFWNIGDGSANHAKTPRSNNCMQGGDNAILNHAVSLQIGTACEITRSISPSYSPVPCVAPIPNFQRGDMMSPHKLINCRAIDTSPCILRQDSVTRQIPIGLDVCEAPYQEPNYPPFSDRPPERAVNPDSPYMPGVISYIEVPVKHSRGISEEEILPRPEAKILIVSPVESDENLSAHETMQRINKLRSILRADEKIYPLQMDKCVQAEQSPRAVQATFQATKECQAGQPSSDLWDTATVSDSSSSDSVIVGPNNFVEDHGDCEKLALLLSNLNPTTDAPIQRYTIEQGLERLRKLPPKSSRSRRRLKAPITKVNEDISTDLMAGAPFMVSRLGRSTSVDDSRNPPSEQASPQCINDSSPRVNPSSAARWEDCINRVYARRRHHSASASGSGRERPRQKKISSRNSCNNDRSKRQDVRPSLLRQTFASAQRCKPSQRS